VLICQQIDGLFKFLIYSLLKRDRNLFGSIKLYTLIEYIYFPYVRDSSALLELCVDRDLQM
jgi:hypothetical protein